MDTQQTPNRTSREPSCPENTMDDTPTIGQRIDRISSASHMAWRGGCDTVREVRDAVNVAGCVERNPYAMMAAAVGSGYVLGGGLFSPFSARLVELGWHIGLRLVAVPYVQRRLLGFAEAAIAGGEGSNRGDSKTQDRTVNEQETTR
jgi:hypothetical protein